MPSIFLSHTSLDKPFVEKLARNLQSLGVNVWFDKWEIKVGDSITWKIEQGIRENEFLGIVLSPEALLSEWVKSEISAAWVKQMQSRKIVVLPILYRSCEIPLFLADRKYADFRTDYQKGLSELANVLGISEIETISIDNWRKFSHSKSSDWKKYRELEFRKLVTVLFRRAKEFNWSSWVGRTKSPFSITLSTPSCKNGMTSVSIRLDNRSYAYMASFDGAYNPNHLPKEKFNIYVGNTVNECEEFVWRQMKDFQSKHGNPTGKSEHSLHKYLSRKKVVEIYDNLMDELRAETNWYDDDNEVPPNAA